jgi:NAD(P)-dependent dehydrogenase (short-subunit alcohol dehydrogenase family)
MRTHTWLITGVSSGFGYEMTRQLLERGDTVIGTVRSRDKVQSLIDQYPDTFDCPFLDVTDVPAIHAMVDDAYARHGEIDVIVSNAGYGLFGCAEELSDAEIDHIIATNLTGSIQLIRSALPYLRRQGGGRIIQLSSYGGQVAFPANSMYHATKFGIEGFCEAVAQEVAQFHIGVTIVEPGGARTQFRYGSAKVAKLMPEYESCHGFLNMLDPAKGLAPGDPAKMASRIIESVELEKAPLRMVLGSQALTATLQRLEERVADYKTQTALAASTDVPAGEA